MAHGIVGLSHTARATAGVAIPTRRLSLPSPLWLLSAALLAGCILLATGPLLPLHPAHSAVTLEWWSLGLLFLVAEVSVLHLYFGRDAHTLSLSEIPLVLGLIFARPDDLVVAQMAGAAVALALHRRQPLHKLAFNVSNLGLSSGIAVLVFRAVLNGRAVTSPMGWAAVTAGVIAGTLAGTALIALAMAVTRRGITAMVVLRIVRDGMAGTLGVTSFGLVTATVLWFQPIALVLLLVPLIVVFTGYRAYSAQHERAAHLEFLYEASRELQEAVDVESAMRSLLSRACGMFHAELAEFTLFPATGDELAYRTRVGRGDDGQVMVPVDLEPVDEGIMELLVDHPAMLIRAGRRNAVADAYLRSRGLRDAMVVSLRGEVRVMGAILLGNRVGDVKSFSEEDLKLLATLASHASVALENGRLEKSVSRLVQVEQQLRRQASHDPTTGLPNRVLFGERLAAAIRRADPARGLPTVLFLDLDDFKQANERVGRSSGDALLAAVGSRLRAVVQPPDTVARLGGDEFAILLERTQSVDQATAVAGKVLRALSHPFGIGDAEDVEVSASIGVVALVEPGSAVPEVFDRADTALFRAKRTGRGGYQVDGPPSLPKPVVSVAARP
jgi:diguanylate cyclase (GGDEF)-like protein